MNELISIVIPVYNIEDNISTCIKSVLRQTYSKIEIILVDDGSTDNSNKICEKYAMIDNRIRVIHKPNGGLSDARNHGIENSTGEYITFVDSDDFISSVYVEKLLNAAVDNNVSIAQCGYKRVNEAGKIISEAKHNEEVCVTCKNLVLEFNSEYCIENVVVWNKIYRRELFKNIKFPIGKINEDEFITYKLFDLSKNIYVINDSLYFYRCNSNSIMGKSFNLKRLDCIEALKERVEYYKNKDFEIYESSIFILLNKIVEIYRDIKKYYANRKDILCELKEIIIIKQEESFVME